MANRKRISDQAVRAKTGKSWQEWFDLLDKAGGRNWPHKEIVRWLSEQELIANAWWRQGVAVEYEYYHGKRDLGKTAAAGYEIGVQRSFEANVDSAWQFLTSPEGVKLWLGDTELRLQKGAQYKTASGTSGEVRSVDAGKRLRITWQPTGQLSSTLQIYLLPQNNKTAVRFHHEKLQSAEQRENMKQHWQQVLALLATAVRRGAR